MKLIRDWGLIIAMIVGVGAYLIYASVPALDCTRQFAAEAVPIIQPALLFAMLFLSFCKLDLHNMRLCRWHLWLLLLQCGSFVALAFVVMGMPANGWRVVLEGAMILLICPTATASPVIVRKLGGNMHHLTTYIILINLLASVLIPVMLPYVHPQPGLTTSVATMMILAKVFPILLLPLVLALLTKQFLPVLHRRFASWIDASFYIWLVSLTISLAVSTRCLCHSSEGIATDIGLFVVSLVCCVAQFWAGRRMGRRDGDSIAAGQAFGQKNTVFAIWLGYTFFTPVTSVAGGFYAIWHNIVNSRQLYKKQHPDSKVVEP